MAALADENELVRKSSKRSVDGLARSASCLSETHSEGTTGLTNYVGDANLDWEAGNAGVVTPTKLPSLSFRKAVRTSSIRKRDQVVAKLPKNWKRVEEEEGAIVYINAVTNERTSEAPRESSPEDERSLKEGSSPKESIFGRTVSLFGGRKTPKKTDGEPSERQSSFRRRSTQSKGEGRGSTGHSQQRTVFISCSALIRETKLCVGEEPQPRLDALLATLAAREVLAEVAVKQLMELVGSTIVQQAGLSVMNAQKSVLPHGWLEYVDEISGRPYYYNVHTRETTWYKPKPPTEPLIIAPEPGEEGEDGFISLEVETHHIAISAEI